MFRKAWFSVSSILFNSDLNFDMESTFRIVSFKHIAHFYCGGDQRISSWGQSTEGKNNIIPISQEIHWCTLYHGAVNIQR